MAITLRLKKKWKWKQNFPVCTKRLIRECDWLWNYSLIALIATTVWRIRWKAGRGLLDYKKSILLNTILFLLQQFLLCIFKSSNGIWKQSKTSSFRWNPSLSWFAIGKYSTTSNLPRYMLKLRKKNFFSQHSNKYYY